MNHEPQVAFTTSAFALQPSVVFISLTKLLYFIDKNSMFT